MNLDDTPFAPLTSHLVDLSAALDGRGVPLLLVDGFGLVLKRQLIEHTGEATFFARLPDARATNDFDLLLTLDLLADVEKNQVLRAALHALGYRVVAGRNCYQFRKPGAAVGEGLDVKVDLLAPGPTAQPSPFKVEDRRIRPKQSTVQLHATSPPRRLPPASSSGARQRRRASIRRGDPAER